MGNVKHVGQPTLNGNQESRELEMLTGALDQTARNRELGGGQRAKLLGALAHIHLVQLCLVVSCVTGPRDD